MPIGDKREILIDFIKNSEKNIIEYYIENFYINTDFQTVAKENTIRNKNKKYL